MKLPSLFLSALAFAPLSASALTISIDADVLKDANGSPMLLSGLVILTAAADGIFNGPSGSSFVTGTEMLLYSWDLTAFGAEGVLSDHTTPLSFTGGWDQGDQLRLYWFPTLTLGSVPTPNTPYGYYSDSTGIDGSAPWITPDESDNMSLTFFTSDSILAPGSNSPDAGIADQLVPQRSGPAPSNVPDEGNTLALAGIAFAGIHFARRLRLPHRNA